MLKGFFTALFRRVDERVLIFDLVQPYVLRNLIVKPTKANQPMIKGLRQPWCFRIDIISSITRVNCEHL